MNEHDDLMAFLDIDAMLAQVTFPREVWAWLHLLGNALVGTQEEGLKHDVGPGVFCADTPYKQLMVRTVNRDTTTMTAIAVLLRFEMLHQAAAHVRLLCEGLITWRFIALDRDARTDAFNDYAHIERLRLAEGALAQEQDRAQPEHVRKLREAIAAFRIENDAVASRFTFTNRHGKPRAFSNWCNLNIADQAKRCGAETERLYEIIYRVTSAYVHGSPWSLRRQLAYSRNHYDPRVIHNDIAASIRTFLVVWVEWCKTCEAEAGWQLRALAEGIRARVDELDAQHFPIIESDGAVKP